MPCSFASCSFSPTRATSGSVKVHQGIDRPVDAEPPEPPEQRVDRGVPGHVRRGVGELVRAGDVADRRRCSGSGSAATGRPRSCRAWVSRDAQLLEPVAATCWRRARARTSISSNAMRDLRARVLGDAAPCDRRRARRGSPSCRSATSTPSSAKRRSTSADTSASSRAISRGAISTCDDLRAEARERQRELAADRPAAEHEQTRAAACAAPTRCRRSGSRIASRPGIGGTSGRAPAAITIAARGRAPRRTVGVRGSRPPTATRWRAVALRRRRRRGRGSARPSRAARSRATTALHALHHVGEVELDPHAERMPNSCERRACDTSFAERSSALDGTQPVFRQSPPIRWRSTSVTLRLHRRGDVRADQPAAARADDDQVAVEARGASASRGRPGAPAPVDDPAWRSAGTARAARTTRSAPATAGRRSDVELAELGARVHVDDRAGEHAELARRRRTVASRSG